MNNSVASKVATARDAADGAAGRCNAARDDAVREAASVVAAGDDVASRDAAALAARDAALRCAAASSAAQAAAACCDAVAEEATARNLASLHDDAAFAAQQARAAAARCDSDGAAVAASAAANAFADSCLAACGDTAALALAAREAAARCVLARDDAANAALVAQEAARDKALRSLHWIWAPFLFKWCRDVAHDDAARKSADAHQHTRRDAKRAAFAARKAGVRCAAASRRALSAAWVAREAASRCDGASAATAREASDRCVADPVVPRTDAAASEARAAAASCDAALAEDFEESLDKMRGWLMAVDVLFVGIAYQAVIQPPAWMTCSEPKHAGKLHQRQLRLSFTTLACHLYFAFNTVTMALALTMLVALLTLKIRASRFKLDYLKSMLVCLVISVAVSFIMAASGPGSILYNTTYYFFAFVISASFYYGYVF